MSPKGPGMADMVALATRRACVLIHGERAGDLAGIDGLLGEVGAEGVEVTSALELRRLLDGDAIDLALADSGWQVVQLEDLLRALHPRREVPVILLAHPDGPRSEWVERSTRRFHVALLHKPTGREDLTDALRHGLHLRACHREHREPDEFRRRADAELERCRARRRDLARRLRGARAEVGRLGAEADAETKRRVWLLSAISHNLRTPVHEVALCCHLMEAAGRDPANPSDWEGLTAGLRDGVAWLRELVDDLVDIAQLDLGAMSAHTAPLPLAPFLDQALEEARREAGRKGLDFRAEVEPPEAVVATDAAKLARILGNLASNAVKFTDAGSVRIALRAGAGAGADAGLVATVVDTGCGIAPDQLAVIFNEFGQVGNPERARAKGTGLGLALCRRLVAAMGGRLDVRSEPGRGSTFTVTLPGAAARDG